MGKLDYKKVITAAFLAGVIGLTGAPLSAGATDNNRHGGNHWEDRGGRGGGDWEDRDNNRRIINVRRAVRIAQNVFPHKRVVRVELKRDNGVREYQVRFADGSRVDVRARDGRVTLVRNESRNHRHHYHNDRR